MIKLIGNMVGPRSDPMITVNSICGPLFNRKWEAPRQSPERHFASFVDVKIQEKRLQYEKWRVDWIYWFRFVVFSQSLSQRFQSNHNPHIELDRIIQTLQFNCTRQLHRPPGFLKSSFLFPIATTAFLFKFVIGRFFIELDKKKKRYQVRDANRRRWNDSHLQFVGCRISGVSCFRLLKRGGSYWRDQSRRIPSWLFSKLLVVVSVSLLSTFAGLTVKILDGSIKPQVLLLRAQVAACSRTHTQDTHRDQIDSQRLNEETISSSRPTFLRDILRFFILFCGIKKWKSFSLSPLTLVSTCVSWKDVQKEI